MTAASLLTTVYEILLRVAFTGKRCIKVVLKGGRGVRGPPPEKFYRNRYKIGQFYAFLDASNDIIQSCRNKRVMEFI